MTTVFANRMIVLLCAGLVASGGCCAGRYAHDPEYGAYAQVAPPSWQSTATCSASQPLVEDVDLIPATEVDSSVSESPQSLDDLIELALQRNPEIHVAQKELDQVLARIPQAASLADPMVDIVGWPIYPNVPQTAAGRMTVDVAISQEIPWRGKRLARVGAVSREAEEAEHALLAVELRVREEVTRAFYDCWAARQSLLILTRDLELLQELVPAVEALYRTGRIGQQDLLRLNTELGLAEVALARGRADEEESLAELRRVLHLPSETPLPLAEPIPDDSLDGELELYFAQALTARPEIQAAWARAARDQWRVEQAKLEYYPDLSFMLGWGDMTTRRALAPTADGIDNLTTGVRFNLPIQTGRRDAALREAESQVVAAVRDIDRLRDETLRDVRQQFAQAVSQREQLRIFRETIVPQAQQALELTVSAYQVNQASFTDLVEVRRELLRLRLAEIELHVSFARAQANLARLIGAP